MAGAGCHTRSSEHGGDRNLVRAPNGDVVAPCLVDAIDLPGGARGGADVPVAHRSKIGVEWFEPEQPTIVRLELKTKPRMVFLY
jgi:hypothetical protein